ncbi:MAG: hypothetical protein LBI85_03840, partial [Spirochaetaceae bacterium]|nr:hypothetical protein [Spirochaetaceae bacterium]
MEELPVRKFGLKDVTNFIFQYAIYFVFIVLVLIITIEEPSFLSVKNFLNILNMSATRIIIAMGIGGILITGGVDLSAGRQVGLAAVLSASLLQTADYSRRMYPNLPILPFIVPVLFAMAACGVFGFLNGAFIARLKVPAFIATLGSQVAVYGVTSLYFDRPPYGAQPIGGFDDRFRILGTNSVRYVEGHGLVFGAGEGLTGAVHKFPINYIIIIAIIITVLV